MDNMETHYIRLKYTCGHIGEVTIKTSLSQDIKESEDIKDRMVKSIQSEKCPECIKKENE